MSAHAETQPDDQDPHASVSVLPDPQALVSNNGQRVLILAPTASDAPLAAQVLQRAGLHPQICADMPNLCAALEGGVGAILLAEEALTPGSSPCLVEHLAKMPSWSDIPIVIVTSGGEDSRTWLRKFTGLGSTGSMVLVERPFRSDTLTSVLQVALRSRQRQYQVRDLLAERSRQEEALRESERQFHTLADSIPNLAWWADGDGYLRWYNQRWYDYTGTAPDQMEGWGWQRVHHPDHVERVTEKFKRALASGEPWEDTFPLRAKGGEYRWFLSRAFPIRDAKGKIAGWFGTNTDITELRDTQLALDEARGALERQNQQLETAVQERTAKLQATIGELEHFSYTLTHDMRAPLRAMQGFCDMLRSELGGHLTPESAVHLDRIMEGARRMDLLIQDSLQYATAIREIIPLARVDPVPVLRSIVETYPGLQSPQAEIYLVQPFPPVIANEAWLSQCFSNLLINAIKFVRPGKVPQVRIWTQLRGNCVRFWFEDNGIGIPAEYHERIFMMFQQLDKSYGGTGVGLALVRKTAERMGGAVGVESEPGQGSRFWLELPLAQD